MNKYVVLVQFVDRKQVTRRVGDIIELTEIEARKLIKADRIALQEDLTQKLVRLDYDGQRLFLFNVRTGARIGEVTVNGIVGTLLGDSFGIHYGDVQGNVAGNLNGNATTATKANGVNADTPVNAVASSLTTADASVDARVTFTAVTKGAAGDNIEVEILNPGVINSPLTITVTANLISISLATGGGGAIESTGSDVRTAVNTDVDASALVLATLPGTGGDVMTDAVAANLAGGVDGTEGLEGVVVVDAGRIYVCTADNTVADANWKRIPVALETF